jgi:hypothetical protein
MSSILKNVASQNITFCLVNASTGAALTGATVTGYVTKDGTQAAAAGTFTELKVSGTGHGAYNYAPTQSETNCTNFGLLCTATSAIPVNLDFHTDVVDSNGYPSVNLADILGTAVSTPATAGVLDVNVKNINNTAAATPGSSGGMQINGTNSGAVTYSNGITITNGSGTGLIVQSTGSNGHAAQFTGNGTGNGIIATGGATGNGVTAAGGSTSGNGAFFWAQNSGTGATFQAAGSSAGIQASGGTTGQGMKLIGGSTSGDAIDLTVTSGVAGIPITSNRKKGATATFEFTMVSSSTGADTPSLTVTSQISKDGGAFASTTNSVTGTANGWYQLVLTATEMTANNIALRMTATGASTRDISIQTQP